MCMPLSSNPRTFISYVCVFVCSMYCSWQGDAEGGAGDSERPMAELQGHEDAVQAVAFEPQGKFLVSASSDCTFRVWGQG